MKSLLAINVKKQDGKIVVIAPRLMPYWKRLIEHTWRQITHLQAEKSSLISPKKCAKKILL